jgi:hypothetical protein
MPGLTPTPVRLTLSQKVGRIFFKNNIEESQSKQRNITKFFPVNQLTLK